MSEIRIPVVIHDGTHHPAGTMECSVCGATEQLELPMPIPAFVKAAEAFQRLHASCPQEVTFGSLPAGATFRRNWLRWTKATVEEAQALRPEHAKRLAEAYLDATRAAVAIPNAFVLEVHSNGSPGRCVVAQFEDSALVQPATEEDDDV